jgi:hypothetical protein
MTILEIVTEWEGPEFADKLVTELEITGEALGARGLWTARETDEGIRLTLVEC